MLHIVWQHVSKWEGGPLFFCLSDIHRTPLLSDQVLLTSNPACKKHQDFILSLRVTAIMLWTRDWLYLSSSEAADWNVEPGVEGLLYATPVVCLGSIFLMCTLKLTITFSWQCCEGSSRNVSACFAWPAPVRGAGYCDGLCSSRGVKGTLPSAPTAF